MVRVGINIFNHLCYLNKSSYNVTCGSENFTNNALNL